MSSLSGTFFCSLILLRATARVDDRSHSPVPGPRSSVSQLPCATAVLVRRGAATPFVLCADLAAIRIGARTGIGRGKRRGARIIVRLGGRLGLERRWSRRVVCLRISWLAVGWHRRRRWGPRRRREIRSAQRRCTSVAGIPSGGGRGWWRWSNGRWRCRSIV
jgi:hypothetical protein